MVERAPPDAHRFLLVPHGHPLGRKPSQSIVYVGFRPRLAVVLAWWCPSLFLTLFCRRLRCCGRCLLLLFVVVGTVVVGTVVFTRPNSRIDVGSASRPIVFANEVVRGGVGVGVGVGCDCEIGEEEEAAF